MELLFPFVPIPPGAKDFRERLGIEVAARKPMVIEDAAFVASGRVSQLMISFMALSLIRLIRLAKACLEKKLYYKNPISS